VGRESLLRRCLWSALIFYLFLAAPGQATEQPRRLALLIGNQAYAEKIGRLLNPRNDVALLETALKDLGFEVTVERDLGLGDMTRAVNSYVRRLRAAGPQAIGLLYYSGHGAAEGGINYLIPVDVKTTETGELWDQSMRLTEVTRKLKAEAGDASHFVVFDACRNSLKLLKPGTRAIVQSKGFVPMVQESGMLIAYATAEGELASDVGQGAGPYAKVLAEEIVKRGIESVAMFRVVQRRVRAAIHQEPYLAFSALGDVYLAGPAVESKPLVIPAPPNQLAPAQLSEAAEAWTTAKDSTDPVILEAFIKYYGDTFYGALARARLAHLQAEAADAKAKAERERQEKAAEAQRAAEAKAKAKEVADAKAKAERERQEKAAEAQRAAEAKAKEAADAKAKEAAEAKAKEAPPKPEKVASLPPATDSMPSLAPAPASEALAAALQAELKRVGCYTGAADGKWDKLAKEALAKFARSAKVSMSGDAPSAEIIETVKRHKERVCALGCPTGQVQIGGKCITKAKREPSPSAKAENSQQRAAPEKKGPGLCWTNRGGFDPMVPCDDPRSTGRKIN
jgi:uncharacterized caspase-like protein